MSSRETAWICKPSSWTTAPACTLRIAGSVSEAANDVRSIATRPSNEPGARSNPSAHGTRSGSEPDGRDLHDAGDDPGVGRRSSTNGDPNAGRPAGAQHEVIRDDGEPERLRLSAGDGADRQLETTRRDVADDERARGVPAGALPDPEAERRRLSRDLADGRSPEPEACRHRPPSQGARPFCA